VRTLKQNAANIACTIFVGYFAYLYWKINILRPIPGLSSVSDFGVYYRAGRDVLNGASPYENPAYFYPPLVAFAMAPFALTDYVTGRWLWFLLSHGLLLLAAWLLWRALGRGRIALCCIAAVWALGGAAKETLDVGQLSPLLVLVLVLACTQRGRLQGASVGLGFALKYIPGLLAVAFFMHRRWRTLVGFAGTVLVTAVLPWLALSLLFAGARAPRAAHYWMGTPAMFSWSIPSMVLRILIPLRRGTALPHDWQFGNVAESLNLRPDLAWISAGAAIATLALGVLVLALVCRGRLNREQVPWAMAGLVSLSLAAAPVCWSHYEVLQYPGVAMLLVSAIRLRAWRATAAAIVCFALLHRLPETFLTRYYDAHNAWTAASPATLYFWTSVTPLACLCLFALALMNVRRTACKPVLIGPGLLEQRRYAIPTAAPVSPAALHFPSA
jgi:Glycosyltransferase family 87